MLILQLKQLFRFPTVNRLKIILQISCYKPLQHNPSACNIKMIAARSFCMMTFCVGSVAYLLSFPKITSYRISCKRRHASCCHCCLGVVGARGDCFPQTSRCQRRCGHSVVDQWTFHCCLSVNVDLYIIYVSSATALCVVAIPTRMR